MSTPSTPPAAGTPDAQKTAPRLRLWERADDGARPAEAEPVESARRIQRADRVASDAPGRARTGVGRRRGRAGSLGAVGDRP